MLTYADVQSQGLRAIPVLGARVPIIKIRDQSDTRLAVDLSVENELPGTHFTCFTGTIVQILTLLPASVEESAAA